MFGEKQNMSDKNCLVHWKLTVIIVILVVFACEYFRIEIVLEEHNARIKNLETKMATLQGLEKRGSSKLNNRSKRSISLDLNMAQDGPDKQLISEGIGKKVARYWINTPGHSGPHVPKGDLVAVGPRGHKGKPGRREMYRGRKGDWKQHEVFGPRDYPTQKGGPTSTIVKRTVLFCPTRLIVNESDSAIFHVCTSGHPKPAVSCSKVNGAIITSQDGKIEFNKVTSDDSGTYRCKATSILGNACGTLTLEVNFAPRLKLIKGPIFRNAGTQVELPVCHVIGHPKPKITWSKATGVLPTNRSFVNNGQLTLLNSRKDDSGYYFCKAENLLGSVISRTIVNVIELPVFLTKPPTSLITKSGTTVTLHCTSKGDPKPTISWRKENGVLPTGRYEIKHGSLLLKNVNIKDSGVFVCTATSAGIAHIESNTKLIIRPNGVNRDCSDIFRGGERRNGIYTVQPDNQGAFYVYCDMSTDGGGWTVFQRRKDGSVDFNRNWQQYKTGFGDLNGEFWLGNEYIHRLTSRSASMLRIDLGNWDVTTKYSKYENFSIDDESDNYRLNVGYYSGTAGDSLSRHGKKQFSTIDRDNNGVNSNCTMHHKGAWWYNNCYDSNLNGAYLGNIVTRGGIIWYKYENNYQSLKTSEMKLRPDLL